MCATLDPIDIPRGPTIRATVIPRPAVHVKRSFVCSNDIGTVLKTFSLLINGDH